MLKSKACAIWLTLVATRSFQFISPIGPEMKRPFITLVILFLFAMPTYLLAQPTDSDASEISGKLPEFSWDTLPLYAHVRKATKFTLEELKHLASFPLITLEKTTGLKDYGSTDAGTIEAAKGIKQFNPTAKVLFYRNVIVHYPGYQYDDQLKSIPDAFLTSKTGEQNLVRGKQKAYDLSNADLRKWWVETMATTCNNEPIDGLFLDGNVKVLSSYLKRTLPDGKKEAAISGFNQMMRDTRKALDPEKLMIANILRARFDKGGLEFMDAFDGSYLEGFEHAVAGASEADYLAKGIETAQAAARQGKLIALTLNVSKASMSDGIDEVHGHLKDFENIDQDRVNFCIALFLVVAERHSYFCLHDGYDINPKGRRPTKNALWLKTLPEYSKKLGKPKGPATKQGYRYAREFEHASVKLDIESGKADIDWK